LLIAVNFDFVNESAAVLRYSFKLRDAGACSVAGLEKPGFWKRFFMNLDFLVLVYKERPDTKK